MQCAAIHWSLALAMTFVRVAVVLVLPLVLTSSGDASTNGTTGTTLRELRTVMSSSSGSAAAVPVEPTQSTCTWNQLSIDGQCELEPRSCYSCLEVLPTSGEICTLTPQGVCWGIDAYDYKQDFRRTGPAAPWPPHLNYFPATNSSYCEKNEKACQLCRDTTFKNWATNPSQYCKGEDGCICVSVCESDNWRLSIQSVLQETLTTLPTTNETLANCTLAEVPTEQLAPSSTEGTTDDFVGLSSTRDVFASDDECRWYVNQTYCGAPRSCFDCLNTALYSGKKCMLHSSGYCTSMAVYDRTKDWRRPNRTDNSISLFASTNTTYCQPDDAVCAQCIATTFTQWQNVSSPAPFCVGTNQCVCIASCEAPNWSSAVVSLTCDTDKIKSLTVTPLAKLSHSKILLTMCIGCLIFLICALMLRTGYKRYIRRNGGVRRHPRRRDPTGPTLELSGWKAMREDLIKTEREFVGEEGEDGGGAVPAPPGSTSSLSHPHHHQYRRRLRSTSSDVVEDAPALIVEEGDAFRPVSPSRMHE